MSIMGSDLGVLGRLEGDDDPDAEAKRVAEAIGYRVHRGSGSSAQGSNLSRVASAASGPSSDSDDDMTLGEERILKSPTMGALDSPYVSDEEDDDHDYTDDVEDVHCCRSLPKMFRKNILSAAMFLSYSEITC